MEHTPGPRTIHANENIACGCQGSMHGIAYCPLHAAAPELLKALEHTRDILHGSTCQEEADCVEACESARDAIEAARKS